MAGLKIKNETVFVIYRNGEPYQKAGRKIVYTTKGAANGVITNDVQDEVWENYKKEREVLEDAVDYWDYDHAEIERLEKEMRKEFEVVPYGPKEARK